jgi:hypothetical protein
MSATSTAQKVAVLREASESMSPEAFRAWLLRATQEQVISPAVRQDALRAQ